MLARPRAVYWAVKKAVLWAVKKVVWLALLRAAMLDYQMVAEKVGQLEYEKAVNSVALMVVMMDMRMAE
jgi:hypothetical protein